MKFGLIYNTGVYGTDPDQLTAVGACGEMAISRAAGSPRLSGPASSR